MTYEERCEARAEAQYEAKQIERHFEKLNAMVDNKTRPVTPKVDNKTRPVIPKVDNKTTMVIGCHYNSCGFCGYKNECYIYKKLEEVKANADYKIEGRDLKIKEAIEIMRNLVNQVCNIEWVQHTMAYDYKDKCWVRLEINNNEVSYIPT